MVTPASVVCAGIVTYNPDLSLLRQNVAALCSQVETIFIIDNGSGNQTDLQAYVDGQTNITLVCNPENQGIAKALNQLCMLARSAAYPWILTMDQDSVCQSDMVAHLLAYADNPEAGILAPRVEFRDGDLLITSTKHADQATVEMPSCITSGSLTRIDAWEQVGGFDEWFFIDMVDDEFCTRLIVNGYKVILVNKAVLLQRAGEMHYVSLPWVGNILLTCYNETRKYYICRNTVFFLRKYHRYIQFRHQLLVFLYGFVRRLVFEPHRWQTVRAYATGIRDGFKRKVR